MVQGRAGSPGLLLTVRQAAARLGVSTATVYRLCERGELEHFRISNAIRIPAEALPGALSPKHPSTKASEHE